MTRPRFHRLAPAQQRAIEAAALDEFARHGFAAASLNRIIEAAGVSKGSMYYYFDGKDDLYAHVVAIEVSSLLAESGPFPVPVGPDPDGFWSTLTDHARRVAGTLQADPRRAALARDWLSAPRPGLAGTQAGLEHGAERWVRAAVVAGQRIGAVRDDAPLDLLVGVALAICVALDGWLLRCEDDRLPAREVEVVLGMLRRALTR